MTPTPVASTAARLVDIACASPMSCFAVGAATFSNGERTLVERWNGTSWTIATSPNVSGAMSDALAGVECMSATNCFAVGVAVTSSGQETLIERWNGAAWSITSTPVTGRLDGVACAAANDCFAVGTGLVTTTSNALVLRWNGTDWAPVVGPGPGGTPVIVEAFAVSCPAMNVCALVGFSEDGFGHDSPFAGQWHGVTWSSVSLPSPDVGSAYDVFCTSVTDCTAVGSWISDAFQRTLIERYA